MLTSIKKDVRGPMKYIKKNYQTWGAEVVYVTGPNHADIVQGCEKVGIPAYVRVLFSSSECITHLHLGCFIIDVAQCDATIAIPL